MKTYPLLETIAYARYTIKVELPVGTEVQVAWPDGTSVYCQVTVTEEGYSICTPA